MFEDDYGQDDFFTDTDSDFNQQDSNIGSADFFGSSDENISEENIPEENNVNFGYKTVGIIVALVLVILALIILGLSNIKLVKRNDSSVKQEVQTTQETTESTVTSSSQSSESKSISTEDVQANKTTGLINIPSDTHMDYSGKVTKSQGVVSSLSKYLQDGQVIYCIDLDITIGSNKNTVHYYCGYNVFKQVKVGDVVSVEYQQVSDTCFSVCTISK